MHTRRKYKKTLLACYLSFVTQAICANFLPLLYMTFHEDYGLSFGNLAVISAVFFLTQLVVDFICAKAVDKIGYRPCIITSEIACGVGLAGLSIRPDVTPTPFLGILICVIVYAIGSGLIEVLASPIIEACPFDNKESMMSLLHSFYCWGFLGVILLSTLFFTVFGLENWRILACIWALIPIYNIYNFVTCPIEKLVEEGEGLTMGQLLKTKFFLDIYCVDGLRGFF
jgi:MFS family permease